MRVFSPLLQMRAVSRIGSNCDPNKEHGGHPKSSCTDDLSQKFPRPMSRDATIRYRLQAASFGRLKHVLPPRFQVLG
ncbi:hypothetical protein KCU68_g195, partial [Aureobasidium melanogenum]